jgi:hypothetical protein
MYPDGGLQKSRHPGTKENRTYNLENLGSVHEPSKAAYEPE